MRLRRCGRREHRAGPPSGVAGGFAAIVYQRLSVRFASQAGFLLRLFQVLGPDSVGALGGFQPGFPAFGLGFGFDRADPDIHLGIAVANLAEGRGNQHLRTRARAGPRTGEHSTSHHEHLLLAAGAGQHQGGSEDAQLPCALDVPYG